MLLNYPKAVRLSPFLSLPVGFVHDAELRLLPSGGGAAVLGGQNNWLKVCAF